MSSEDEVYGYVRLYRVLDYDREVVERELRRLGEFIKHRSSVVKEASYYAVTYVDGGEQDGLIVVASRSSDVLARELELLTSFVESTFESIRAEVVNKVKSKKLLPLPATRNF